MIFFVLFFSSFIYADSTDYTKLTASWSFIETQKIIESKKTIQTLKEQKDCVYSSPSANSVLDIFETLKQEETIQALIEPHKQKFLCRVDNYISEQNKETTEDQKFMLNYLNNSANTQADDLKMTELLIKYRLLRDKNWKEYYVSATRFQPPEETKRQTRQLAESYIKEFGPPTHCFFVENNKVKKSNLTDELCREEISLKVRPIPAPLVLTQSVLESDWGNSNWAQKESNILGLQVKFRDPSSMPAYSNCRPAEKDPSRCVLKFESYKGAIYEYFSRFNGSHLSGYNKYRTARKDVQNDKDLNNCQKATRLSKAIDFYAENPNYVKEIQSMIDKEVCNMVSTACSNKAPLTASR